MLKVRVVCGIVVRDISVNFTGGAITSNPYFYHVWSLLND